MTVELSIYSADKIMTLDKYSRAYTAKKLYSEIFSKESEKFSNVNVANHMQLLKYKKSKEKEENNAKKIYEWTERDELRIPYVVQYNESFYDFIARTANRYGEFLYFEDGNLNLGMQPSETSYYRRDSSGNIVKKDDADDKIDWATESNAVQSRYYESVISDGIDVEDRAYNFIGHTLDSGDDYAYVGSTKRYNFDPVSTDEWTTQALESKNYHEFKEILGEEMLAFIPEFIFKCLEKTNLGEAIVELTKETAGKIYEIWNTVADYNNQLDYANYKENKDLVDLIKGAEDNYLIEDDQKSGSDYTQFATLNGSDNLKSNLKTLLGKDGITNFIDLFYSYIRKKEKEIGEQAVWLDFGTNYRPIKLGDKLCVDTKDYVVISVEGGHYKENENDKDEHLLISAIPILKLGTVVADSTTDNKCDVWTNAVPFPPVIPGAIICDARPQVAFVAETLDPQNLGRIRVRYPWQDKDGDLTPWIRVTLPMATAGGAVNFTPCAGDEVMVGYEHGNIDRPYAMGYLAAPFVNEKWKNALPLDQYGGIHGIRTKTGHHLTFSDGFAAFPMLANTFGPLSAFKSLWPVGALGPWPWGNETTADLGGGFELSDRYGFYKITGSTDERSVTIESPAGTVELNAFQGITISAPNGDIEIKGKNVSISASNQMSISAGGTIKDKLRYQKDWTDGPMGKLKSFGLMGLSSVDDAFGALLSETLGQCLDISFLRCVVEYLLHPVNGTLQIKSYTFVTIEAGEGETSLPPISLRSGNEDVEKQRKPYLKILCTTSLIKTLVPRLIGDLRQRYDRLCDATEAFKAISGEGGINKKESAITYDTIIKKGDTSLVDTDFTWQGPESGGNDLKEQEYNFALTEPQKDDYTKGGKLNEGEYRTAWAEYITEYLFNEKEMEDNEKRKQKRDLIMEISQSLRIAAKDLADAAKFWKDLSDNDVKTHPYKKEDVDVSAMVKAVKQQELIEDQGVISLDDMKNGNYEKTIEKLGENVWDLQARFLSRYTIYKYLSDQSDIKMDKTKIKSIDDAVTNDKWKEFVDTIEYDESKGGAWSFVKDHFKDDVFGSYVGIKKNQKIWSHGFEGKILMSDQANKTASFDDNLALISHSNKDYIEEVIGMIKETLKKY